MPNYPLLRDDCKNNIEKELNQQDQKVGPLKETKVSLGDFLVKTGLL